ncbi:E3 binding domain-containing protein [Pannonibacter phragmitetus]|uniref:E3 binding domain-containing protein n=1 Tax=Pannonibacter phragmitetus TaxID=121719 RepID=UPI003D2F1ECC
MRATPLARSLAREGGVDLGAISGSGPQGRVQGRMCARRLKRAGQVWLSKRSFRLLQCRRLPSGRLVRSRSPAARAAPEFPLC